MTKIDWLQKQIGEAFRAPNQMETDVIPNFVSAVEAIGDKITLADFMNLFRMYCPAEAGHAHTEYMIFDTQLSYAADFSEVWPSEQTDAMPELELSVNAGSVKLPDRFLRLGGEPNWIQGECYPPCNSCNADMVLFAQFSAVHEHSDHPALKVCEFGDSGHLYIFTCLRCGTFEAESECY